MNQRIITTFKTYYQRRTLKKMVKVLDAPNKPVLKELQTKYNILKTFHNIDAFLDD